MTDLLKFTRPPVRYIELRSIDRRRGLWQAYYAGDEWTPEFATVVGQRWMVEDGLRDLDSFHGLPLVVLEGDLVVALLEDVGDPLGEGPSDHRVEHVDDPLAVQLVPVLGVG